MRISILCTPESRNLIQRILTIQNLAAQASVAGQAFELGLRALAGDEQHEAAAEHDLAVLEQARVANGLTAGTALGSVEAQ